MPLTILLVHSAFAGSASWDDVVEPLQAAGHRVIAAANPLRGLRSDAAAVSDLVRTIAGPVLLVGHCYGGAVISNVDADAGDIVGLVYVAGFAPAPGESCITLLGMFPGSTLGGALEPVLRGDGATDLYVARESFHTIFCQDVPVLKAAVMGATQRPATQEALTEPSGERPLWQEVPSWFVIGEEDRIIPPALQRFMAKRAGAQRTVAVEGASHALPVSNPTVTVHAIFDAVELRVAV